MEMRCAEGAFPQRCAPPRLTFEGIFRQHMIVKGRNRDMVWYSILDSDWPERKAAFERWLDPSNFDSARRKTPLGLKRDGA